MNMKQTRAEYGLSPLPNAPTEAMAYVPYQPYSPEMCQPVLGYENGTVFKALNKPFFGGKCGGAKND